MTKVSTVICPLVASCCKKHKCNTSSSSLVGGVNRKDMGWYLYYHICICFLSSNTNMNIVQILNSLSIFDKTKYEFGIDMDT